LQEIGDSLKEELSKRFALFVDAALLKYDQDASEGISADELEEELGEKYGKKFLRGIVGASSEELLGDESFVKQIVIQSYAQELRASAHQEMKAKHEAKESKRNEPFTDKDGVTYPTKAAAREARKARREARKEAKKSKASKKESSQANKQPKMTKAEREERKQKR